MRDIEGKFIKGQHYSSKTEFKKGIIPWNKGKHPEYIQGKNHPMFGIHRYGKDAPHYGHKHTEEAKRKMSIAFKGKKLSEEHRIKMGIAHKGKKCSEETKRKIGLANSGINSHWWKGKFSNTRIRKEKYNILRKEERHRLGISKKYREEYSGISKTKEYKKLQRHKRRALFKNGGELSIKTIQQVYEDSIKLYGTLTCYLCLQPIPFGKDHLEHKIPLSRGGTNARENLDIACQHCNNKKFTKTDKEFKERILSNG